MTMMMVMRLLLKINRMTIVMMTIVMLMVMTTTIM